MYFISYTETSAGIDWHRNAVMEEHPLIWFAHVCEGVEKAKKAGMYHRPIRINFWSEFDPSILKPESLSFLIDKFRG